MSVICLQKWRDISKSSPNWKRLAGFVVSAVIFCMTVELCTRIEQFLRFDAPLFGEYSSNILRFKGQNVPNAQFEKWRNNHLGFRGPDITTSKRIGISRVVCMGASETYGLYESPGKEWPAQLRGLLPARYEVINSSVVGLPLNGYPTYLDRHVFPLAPDVVVVVASPLLMIAQQKRDTTTKTNKRKTTAAVQGISIKERLTPTFRCLAKTKQIAKQMMAEHAPALLKKYQILSNSRQVNELESSELKGKKPFDTVPDTDLQRFRHDLEHVIDMIMAHHARVIVCTYPYMISDETIAQYPEIMLDNRRFAINFSFNGMKDAFSKANEVIVSTSREKGATAVDIAAKLPKSKEYFGDNVHYTDKGSRLFAEMIASQFDPKPGRTIEGRVNR